MYMQVLDLAEARPEPGFTTGIRELDIILGGLRRGNVTLFAAQTSFGKSSLGVTTALANVSGPGRPLVISAEDQSLMYGKRMVASECRINAIRLRDGRMDHEDLRKLTIAVKEKPDDPIFLDAIGQGKTVEWIAQAIKELSAEYGISLVLADYIQRFKTKKQFGSDRRTQVTYIGETISDAIKNANATGIAFSQLKRTQGHPPSMDDVKESGDLENMAEHVVIGWRKIEENREEGEAPEHRLINVPKNKDGPIEMDWHELEFDHITASFTGVARKYNYATARKSAGRNGYGAGAHGNYQDRD
jgi:replicative DNA helicase